jgi:hypothetical protein
MSEYIEKEALIENLNQFAPEHYNALVNMLITKQPAADVVAVVRCKDCKYYGDTAYGDMCKCWEDWLSTEDDDFCSYGERRVEDATD